MEARTSMTFILLLLVLGIILGAVVGRAEQKQIEKTRTRIMATYKPDRLFVSPVDRSLVAVNFNARKIVLGSQNLEKEYDFGQIASVEVVENGITLAQTNRGSQFLGAAIGGLAFGGIGAVIGGLSGSSRTRERLRSISLKVTVDDRMQPVHSICFFHSSNQKGADREGLLARLAFQTIEQFHGHVVNAIRQSQANAVVIRPSTSNAADSAVFCCACGQPLRESARFCTSCGAAAVLAPKSISGPFFESAPQSPPPPPVRTVPLPGVGEKDDKRRMLVLTIFLFLVLGCVVAIIHWAPPEQKTLAEQKTEDQGFIPNAGFCKHFPFDEACAKTRAEFEAMTPAQHYQAAKTLLTNDAQPTAIDEAHDHIQALPQGSRESAKAAALWNQFSVAKKQRDVALARQQTEQLKKEAELNKAAMITAREILAKSVEAQMLDEGYEMDVKAIGPDKATLYIRYALAGKVFVHQFSNLRGIFTSARQAGFKKIQVSDGYESTWTWKL